MKPTILIVDDHPVMRKGLRTLLEEEGDLLLIGEADDGRQALELVQEHTPSVVIMDITMPDLNGIDATHQILAEAPDTKVIALSIHSEKHFVEDMLLAGASGYVLKESVPEELVEAIRTVIHGNVYLSPTITDIVVGGYRETLIHSESLAGSSKEFTIAPILSTKLNRPPITPDMISRSHLLKRLDRGRGRALTLITAPAGYGKSILASSWLSAGDVPGAWVSLDEDDDKLQVFLRYFAAAVQSHFPQSCQEIAAIAKAPRLPRARELARMLSNELQKTENDFILVLDNFHYIHETSIHEMITELLRYPPQNMHLVICSRGVPPLYLSKLRAERQMTEMQMKDLRFSVDETSTLFQASLGEEPDKELVARLVEKTEGWVTGLRLAILSLRHTGDTESFLDTLAGDSRYLEEYLVGEVLSKQPKDVQAYMLKTSILDRFCAPLCDALCSLDDDPECGELSGEEFIDFARDAGLFMVPVDVEGIWYRYQQLFKDILQRLLEAQLDRDEVDNLRRCAGAWYAQFGSIGDGLKLTVAGGDAIGAAIMVEQNRHNILNEDKWYVLESWISILPETVRERPDLLMAQAWVDFHRLDFTGMITHTEAAERNQDDVSASETLQSEIDFFKGYVSFFLGEAAKSRKRVEEALKTIPDGYPYIQGEAELHYALALQMEGKSAKAVECLENWLRENQNQGTHARLRGTRLWGGLCLYHLLDGNLPESLLAAKQLQITAADFDDQWARIWGEYTEVQIHFMRGALSDAEQTFNTLTANPYILDTRVAIDALGGLFLIHQMRSREKAQQVENLLSQYAVNTGEPAYISIARSFQARAALMRGDIASAVDLQKGVDLSLDEEIMLFWLEIPRLTACRVQIAEGSSTGLQRAIDSLVAYKEQNLQFHHPHQVMVIQPLLAVAYWKQDRIDVALECLQEGLELGEPGGWIWPFVEPGPQVAEILRKLESQGVTRDYLARILDSFPSLQAVSPLTKSTLDGAKQPSKTPPLVEPLTPREMETLRLLALDLSTEEIADEMVISVDTVRSHSKSIYGKLDVHSRYEAVDRAKELNLI